MKKTYIVESMFNNMRIDRWIRKKIEQIPQSLIEKSLRNGKIKLNNKIVKSSFKVKSKDIIDIYSFKYKHSDGIYEGVLAQEVPQARIMTDLGFYMVDYSKLDVDFKRLN